MADTSKNGLNLIVNLFGGHMFFSIALTRLLIEKDLITYEEIETAVDAYAKSNPQEASADSVKSMYTILRDLKNGT